MRSLLTNQYQAPMCGGGSRSVSTGGFRSPAVRRPLLQAKGTVQFPVFSMSRSVATGGFRSSSSLSPIPPLRSLSSSPPPWLLVLSSYFYSLDHDKELLDHYPYCFVSLSDNKIFRLDKTQVLSQRRLAWDDEFFFPDDAEFYGTSPLGWVLMMHPRTLQMYLVNPLFPSDSVVSLPPLHDLDGSVVAGSVCKSFAWSDWVITEYVSWEKTERYDVDPKDNTEMHHKVACQPYFSPRFAISWPPSHPSCTVLVEREGLLHFWKPGQKSWTEMREPNAEYDGNSIVYSSTHECFYVLDGTNLDAWEWDSSSPQPQLTGHYEVDNLTMFKRYQFYSNSVEWKQRGKYLVESPTGDIWLALMYRVDSKETGNEYDPPSLIFFVYELKFELQRAKWKRVKCLGEGVALFLGANCGLCTRVGDYPGLKPNCIYYTDPNVIPLDMVLEYDFGDHTVHPHRFVSDYDHDKDGGYCLNRTSIWLIPSTDFKF